MGSSGSSALDSARAAATAAARAAKDEIDALKVDRQIARLENDDNVREERMKFLELEKQMSNARADSERELLSTELQHNRDNAVASQRRFDDQMDANREQVAMLRDSMGRQDVQMQQVMEQHKLAMEVYKTQNADSIAALTATINALKDESASFVFDEDHPNRYNELDQANFTKFCDAAATYVKDVPKVQKKSIAVLGPSGVGKSTIINLFARKAVTAVGATECTDNISMVFGEGNFDFYDVPGSHDVRADFYKVDNLHKLKSLHMMLVVFESRVAHCIKICKLMVSMGVPFICVRNKCNFRDGSDWEEAKRIETTTLRTYTRSEIPLIYIGWSDPANGGKIDNFAELEGLTNEMMAHV